jgi:hypothetical protein
VSISHIAHAFTSLLDRPAPPPGVDPHMQLPELLPDMESGPGERNAASGWGSGGDGDFASRSADSDLWPFLDDGGIGSAREGLELLEVLRRCAASVFACSRGGWKESRKGLLSRVHNPLLSSRVDFARARERVLSRRMHACRCEGPQSPAYEK